MEKYPVDRIRITKYFYHTKVTDGDVMIEYLPNDKIWVDMNTKPMQRTGYQTDYSLMMNCAVDLLIKQYASVAAMPNKEETPYPKSKASLMPPEIPWEGSQECVGCMRQLG